MKIDKILVSVVLLSLLSSLFCIYYIIPYANVVWDESLAQSWVYIVFAGLKNPEVSLLTYAFWGQVVYPPLFSFFYALPSIIYPVFTITQARTAGLFWFVASGLLLYYFSKKLFKKSSSIIGLIASMFFFTAPLFLVHASVGLREIVAVIWSLATLYWYVKSPVSVVSTVLTSVGLICLFGIKYQYALFLLAPMGIEAIIELFSRKKLLLIIVRHVVIIVPVIIASLAWMYYPNDKSTIIFDIFLNKFNYTGGEPFLTYLLLIPKIFIYCYSFSPLLGILLPFSLFYSIRWLRLRTVRILWMTVIINIVLALSHTNNIQERYFMLTIPFLYILTGLSLTHIYTTYITPLRGNRIVKTALYILTGLIFVTISIDVKNLPRTVYAIGSHGMKSPLFNQLDYKDTWFNFDRRSWPNRMPWESKESPQMVLDFIMENLVLSKEYVVLGRPGEIAPDLVNITAILRRMKKQYPLLDYKEMRATIEVLPSSRYYTKDFQMLNAWRISEIREVEKNPEWKIYKKRDFAELGMIVTIFGKEY